MPRTEAPVHVGITPDQVIDAAARLTRSSHLFTWSIRDLAGSLDVAQAVIYHYVGGKDSICRGVVERDLSQISVPVSDSSWQEWFREMLSDLAAVCRKYPGFAKWALMHGPAIPAAQPIIEARVTKLQAAGFGERSAMTYALLFNTAAQTLSMNDDRLQHEGDGPRDHASMMLEFEQMPTASPQMRQMWGEFLRPFAAGSGTRARGDSRESDVAWPAGEFACGPVMGELTSAGAVPGSRVLSAIPIESRGTALVSCDTPTQAPESPGHTATRQPSRGPGCVCDGVLVNSGRTEGCPVKGLRYHWTLSAW